MSMLDSSARKNGHWRYILRSSARRSLAAAGSQFRYSCTALPNPYQPGNVRRHWPQLKLQGMARRSSIRCDDFREAGREPMLSCAISRIGVESKKYSVKPGVS
jgi:hypothetical protein